MDMEKPPILTSVERPIEEGDFVLVLESAVLPATKPDISTTQALISQVRQKYHGQDKVILAEPGENINTSIPEGSTTGYIRTSMLVPFRVEADETFKSSDEEIEKGEPVSIRIGKKD